MSKSQKKEKRKYRQEEPYELEAKPLLEHLKDLRRLIIKSLGVIMICFLVIFSLYSKQLIQWVSLPIEEMNIEIIYTEISEAFTSQLKLSFIAGVVVASPYVFFSLWRFIRPALYKNERMMFSLLMISGLFLFVLGVVFAYFMVFRLAINFFVVSGEEVAMPMLSLEKYVSFMFSFLLPFGLMFETPIVILSLARIGIVDTKMLVKGRKYMILLVFIVAAVLTPPDVISQTFLAVPLLLLFEISIILSRLVRPRGNLEEDR